jgi:chromosome segregation ATPase
MRVIPLILCLMIAVPALAQADDAALRKATAAMRAAQDRAAAADAALAVAQQQNQALARQLEAAKPGATPGEDDEALRGKLEELKQQNAELTAGLQQAQASSQQAMQAAGAEKAAAARTAAAAKSATAAVTACKDANVRMLAVGQEVLHLYESKSFISMVLKSYEPVLGLKRVALENLVQDYEDKLRDAEFFPGQEVPKP